MCALIGGSGRLFLESLQGDRGLEHRRPAQAPCHLISHTHLGPNRCCQAHTTALQQLPRPSPALAPSPVLVAGEEVGRTLHLSPDDLSLRPSSGDFLAPPPIHNFTVMPLPHAPPPPLLPPAGTLLPPVPRPPIAQKQNDAQSLSHNCHRGGSAPPSTGGQGCYP